ncbi:hypothetical protein DMENIID0001_147300 [Sergentomyia squamirostris]
MNYGDLSCEFYIWPNADEALGPAVDGLTARERERELDLMFIVYKRGRRKAKIRKSPMSVFLYVLLPLILRKHPPSCAPQSTHTQHTKSPRFNVIFCTPFVWRIPKIPCTWAKEELL